MGSKPQSGDFVIVMILTSMVMLLLGILSGMKGQIGAKVVVLPTNSTARSAVTPYGGIPVTTK
jgi:hypothetical protein